ncbi:hypothetical protein, partial [Ruminococcus intestinalis]|uniref:hypothetical protein n=1 Tax=Ruminococcus intestinalis TaxID=2763066 RepID=UPI003F7F360F
WAFIQPLYTIPTCFVKVKMRFGVKIGVNGVYPYLVLGFIALPSVLCIILPLSRHKVKKAHTISLRHMLSF